MKDNIPKTAAVIDIGSHSLRMKAAQPNGGELSELDVLEYPTELGHDTFNRGSVSAKTADDIAWGVNGFFAAAAQLGVEREDVRIIATTALREAENSAYVTDRLSLRAGIPVEVLEDAQEKSLIFCEVLRRLQVAGKMPQGAFLLAYIGTGSIGMAVVRHGQVVFVRNIRAGSLKLSQMLNEIESRPGRLYEVLEEYLRTVFWGIEEQVMPYLPAELVVCGRDMEMIAEMVPHHGGESLGHVDTAHLEALYDNIKKLTPGEVHTLYHISLDQSESLLPSLCIYLKLAGFAHTDKIWFSDAGIADWMLYEMLQPKAAKSWRGIYEEGIVATAKETAKRLGCDMNHVEAVQRNAVTLFNMLRKVHGFSRRERILLQVAAAMHDSGRYVSMVYHEQTSSHMVQDAACIGLTQRELRMAAQIVRYHAFSVPSMADPEYAQLSPKDALAVSKLAAILRLAESLDMGHQQKLGDIEVSRQENTIVITASARQEAALEMWSFRRRTDFFSEVFGLQCELKIKRGD